MDRGYRESEIVKKALFSQKIKAIMYGFSASIIISWTFYDSAWAMILSPVIIYLTYRILIKYFFKEMYEKILIEYQDFLNGIVTWISSGSSIEKAFLREEGELLNYLGEESLVLTELKKVNSKVRMNEPIERAFYEFARYFDIDEIWEFAEIFVFSKRLGGDYSKNMRLCADRIGEVLEVRREIVSQTVEKRTEVKSLALISIFLLLFIKKSSYDFVSPLYHSLAGILVMSAALIIYLVAIWLAIRIIESGEEDCY